MAPLLGTFNALLLAAVACLHGYWALGGRWGFQLALPQNKQHQKVLAPTAFDCALVGTALFAMSMFYLWSVQLISIGLPGWLLPYGCWGFSSIFFLRALGDFRYLGFSKQIRNTRFARLDTYYYAPLCLLLALNSAGIALSS